MTPEFILALLTTNPSLTFLILVCFLGIFVLPNVLHFLALKGVVKELKGSVDRLDKRLDGLFDFILKHLTIKDKG